MKKVIFSFLFVVLSLSLNANETKGLKSLSPELRSHLSQEMLAIQDGMKDIFSNIISGNYEEVSSIATKIKNSYILKKELTPSQVKELQTKLPKDFLIQDKAFHDKAGELAAAAEFEEVKNMTLFVSQLTNSCVKCHSAFAQSRFTNFE